MGPFADALSQINPEDKGAVLVRVDLEGNAKAVIAWRIASGFSLGAEFDWAPGKARPSGYVGVEWRF